MSIKLKDGVFVCECDACGDYEEHTLSVEENNGVNSVKFEMLNGWTYGIEDDEIVSLCKDCSAEYEPYNRELSIKDFCNLDNENFI